MSAKTKIVVLRRKELAITIILTAVGVLLLILLLSMLLPGEKDTDSGITAQTEAISSPVDNVASEDTETMSSDQIYTPGIYTTELVLGGQSVDVEVIVSENAVESIRLINLEESVTTMYPLLEPTLESICEQVYESQSLDDVTYSSDNKYTSLVLIEAIRSALNTASL